VSRIGLINYKLIVIDYTIVFETMIDLFRSLCFNRLPCDIIDYFSFKSVLEVIKNTLINYFSFKSVSKVINNTLINYIEDLVDYIILERFPIFGKNTNRLK